jgi:hypothetical protein
MLGQEPGNQPPESRRMNSRLERHEVRLRGLIPQSAQADFVPFQPAVSTDGPDLLCPFCLGLNDQTI